MDLKTITLADLLVHKSETIRRNAISIYKTLIAIDKTIKPKYTEYYCQDCDEVNHNGNDTCPKCKGHMNFYTDN